MDIRDIVTNDYMQLAVLVSGLITLIMLLIQGYRILLGPLLSILKNGIYKSQALRKSAWEREVKAAASDQSMLVIFSATRLFQTIFALANIVLAAVVTLVSAVMFVPGYGGPGVELITLGMSAKTAAILSSLASAIALGFFIFVALSGLKFLRHVLKSRLRQEV